MYREIVNCVLEIFPAIDYVTKETTDHDTHDLLIKKGNV